MHFVYLGIAIVSAVVGTLSLKATREFTRLIPSLVVLVGYGSAFYFLTLSLRSLSVGIAYAIWSGLGVVLVALAGIVVYKESLDFAAISGMALIVTGVIIINVYSKTVIH